MEEGAVLEDAPGRDAHGSTRYKTPERKKAVKRSVAVEDGPETLRRRMDNQMDDDEGVSLSPGGDQAMQNDGSPGQQWYDSEIASGSNANVDMQDDGNPFDEGPSELMRARASAADADMSAVFDTLDEEEKKVVESVIRGVDVTEIYSPASVNRLAATMGLIPGHSLDLTNGWDFSREEHRRKAWNLIKSTKPYT